MLSMVWNSFATGLTQTYHPPIFFLVGLLGSTLICLLSLAAHSSLRLRRHGDWTLASADRSYQRYRQELNSAPRHVGFAESILELDDRDLRVE